MPQTSHRFLVTFGEFGDFEEMTGGDPTSVMTDHYGAGRNSPKKVRGTNAAADMTIARAYEPGRDSLVLDWCERSRQGREGYRSVTKIPLNEAGIPNGPPKIYKVLYAGHTTPAVKAGDSSLGMLSITLAVEADL